MLERYNPKYGTFANYLVRCVRNYMFTQFRKMSRDPMRYAEPLAALEGEYPDYEVYQNVGVSNREMRRRTWAYFKHLIVRGRYLPFLAANFHSLNYIVAN